MSEYLNLLLADVGEGLHREQGHVRHVGPQSGPDGLAIVMEAGGRRLSYEVEEPVYHYEPDGLDVARHAIWLVQLFDQEARQP